MISRQAAPESVSRLEDLPNIGKSIANDLRAIGIKSPAELRKRVPKTVFDKLKEPMGLRHDPCVLYTLLSVKHYFDTAESLSWWHFTGEGKKILDR